jgi:hypothetical protein
VGVARDDLAQSFRSSARRPEKELIGHLRSKRSYRRPRHVSDGRRGERITGAVPISERPAEADDRAVPGHWEGDLVEGSRGTLIATLVERRSRFVILIKLSEKRTEAVVEALIKAVRRLPTALRKSLTWDRGSELADHTKFTIATDVKVYFCDPCSPWATRKQREHQRTTAPVLSEGNGSLCRHSSATGCCGQEVEYSATADARLEDSGANSGNNCFDDPLSPSYLCNRNRRLRDWRARRDSNSRPHGS